MLDTKVSVLAGRIAVGSVLSSHLRSELQHVMSRVRPEDLTAAEIVALLDILIAADTRVVDGPACGPGSRVRGVCREHPASDLA